MKSFGRNPIANRNQVTGQVNHGLVGRRSAGDRVSRGFVFLLNTWIARGKFQDAKAETLLNGLAPIVKAS